LIKIIIAFTENNTMDSMLKQAMIDHIEDNLNDLTYEIKAELAILYASKMDKTYKSIFFSKLRDKFIKEIKYLKEETLYKILWAMIKAEELKISDDSPEWILIKDILKQKSKELSPKVIADILLLSTLEGVT
jgi:hypothetical protein